jgi:negative regulator of flagellin synthesis FlgM
MGGAPAAAASAGKGADASPAQSAVFALVAGGAPIDTAKVSAVRAAIAEGRYPVDPAKIAARMVEMDLPSN